MFLSVVSDSVFLLSARWMLATIFVGSIYHKFSSPAAFIVTLRDYQLLPESMVRAVAFSIIGLECIIAVALVAGSTGGSVAAALLLGLYTLAILVNMIRGRRDIQCGCGGLHASQTVSYWLVGRNSILVIFALATAMISGEQRLIGLLDGFTALAAAGSFAFIYHAGSQLTSISSRYTHH